jgi:hypothetical protein
MAEATFQVSTGAPQLGTTHIYGAPQLGTTHICSGAPQLGTTHIRSVSAPVNKGKAQVNLFLS